MRSNEQAWRKARAAMGQRFFLGMVVAGSLTLVAFEWRMAPADIRPWSEPLPPEDDWDRPPVVVIFEQPGPKAAAPRGSTARLDPTRPATPTAEPTPEPSPTPGPVTNGPAVVEPSGGEESTTTLPYVPKVGVKPHFGQCLLDDPEHVDPCTEERILAHLQRRFEMPRQVRGLVRTTITFRVEEDGSIGRIVCAPKVDPEVQREVERVLRALPRLEPGTQGGVPVPVYYQIPLSLRAA